jgi:hypothetical protein
MLVNNNKQKSMNAGISVSLRCEVIRILESEKLLFLLFL